MPSKRPKPTGAAKRPLPQRLLLQARQAWRDLGQLLDRLERTLASQAAPVPPEGPPWCHVVIDGRVQRLSERQVDALDPEAFGFYLDLTRGLLFTRMGKAKGRFQDLQGCSLQADDLNTLAVLVEHANRYIGRDNIGMFLDDAEFLSANTLSQRLSHIRAVVQDGRLDGPYIRRTSKADRSASRTGFAYYFDGSVAPYCLIRFADRLSA